MIPFKRYNLTKNGIFYSYLELCFSCILLVSSIGQKYYYIILLVSVKAPPQLLAFNEINI